MQILILTNLVSIVAERFNRARECRFLERARHDLAGIEVRVLAAPIGRGGG